LSGCRSPDDVRRVDDDSRPSASLETLRVRADLLARARDFFRARGILEVETPVLCAAGAVDEHLDPIPASWHPAADPARGERRWLVTSPEHSMKRLLAAGSGPIYQIGRAFRDGERGRLHNPEFTIIEWYRPALDHLALMAEVEALVRALLDGRLDLGPGSRPFPRTTYRDAFIRAIGIDPFIASVEDLARAATERGLEADAAAGRDSVLNILLAAAVEPDLARDAPEFLLDYPPSQAALARVRDEDPPVAERFELYIRGLELANGYHELLDAREQERRFREANLRRGEAGKIELPIDARLIRALEVGLPACAGVAMGFDRIVMLATGAKSIDEVLAFPIERA
jgi:elongation factor P--(R)-beta-lysine ligase